MSFTVLSFVGRSQAVNGSHTTSRDLAPSRALCYVNSTLIHRAEFCFSWGQLLFHADLTNVQRRRKCLMLLFDLNQCRNIHIWIESQFPSQWNAKEREQSWGLHEDDSQCIRQLLSQFHTLLYFWGGRLSPAPHDNLIMEGALYPRRCLTSWASLLFIFQAVMQRRCDVGRWAEPTESFVYYILVCDEKQLCRNMKCGPRLSLRA